MSLDNCGSFQDNGVSDCSSKGEEKALGIQHSMLQMNIGSSLNVSRNGSWLRSAQKLQLLSVAPPTQTNSPSSSPSFSGYHRNHSKTLLKPAQLKLDRSSAETPDSCGIHSNSTCCTGIFSYKLAPPKKDGGLKLRQKCRNGGKDFLDHDFASHHITSGTAELSPARKRAKEGWRLKCGTVVLILLLCTSLVTNLLLISILYVHKTHHHS